MWVDVTDSRQSSAIHAVESQRDRRPVFSKEAREACQWRTNSWDYTPQIYDTLMKAISFKDEFAPATEHQETTKEETPMNTMYTEKNCRVAGVTLNPFTTKEYAYALFLKDVEPGAEVVVRNSDGSLVLGRLTSIDSHPHEKVKNGCEVICVIDMTEYNRRQEQFAKVAELRKKMDARVKALQDIALYEMLAKDDPELKDLLAEFKTVSQ